jgi:hypothetical protein
MLSRTVSTLVDSCCCPAVTSTARGTPEPSVTKWNLLLNPPFERPRAWSSGSSRCRSKLFLKRPQRPGMLLHRSRRYTRDSSRFGHFDPDESAKPVVYGRRCHRPASGGNSDKPSSRVRIVLADRATEHPFEESKGCHLAFVLDPCVCGRSWLYASVTVLG